MQHYDFSIDEIHDMWRIIEGFNWSADHDYKRILKEFKKLPKKTQTILGIFVDMLMESLDKEYDNIKIPVSDDSWNDLRAEVIGRGQQFFHDITGTKLLVMAEKLDYHESFIYGIVIPPKPQKKKTVHDKLAKMKKDAEDLFRARKHYRLQSEFHRLMYENTLAIETLEKLIANDL